MQKSKTSPSDAAALVQEERRRQRAQSQTQVESVPASPEPPKEEVQPVKWIGAEAGDVDESEIARKQRAISEKLQKRQRQLQKDGAELERVRRELEALEEPLKAEIMSIRTALEASNKREKLLVDEINALRSDLHKKEKLVAAVRTEKQQHADNLINVMADYEKRKTDALNSIARLVGEEPVDCDSPSGLRKAQAEFAGF